MGLGWPKRGVFYHALSFSLTHLGTILCKYFNFYLKIKKTSSSYIQQQQQQHQHETMRSNGVSSAPSRSAALVNDQESPQRLKPKHGSAGEALHSRAVKSARVVISLAAINSQSQLPSPGGLQM